MELDFGISSLHSGLLSIPPVQGFWIKILTEWALSGGKGIAKTLKVDFLCPIHTGM